MYVSRSQLLTKIEFFPQHAYLILLFWEYDHIPVLCPILLSLLVFLQLPYHLFHHGFCSKNINNNVNLKSPYTGFVNLKSLHIIALVYLQIAIQKGQIQTIIQECQSIIYKIMMSSNDKVIL